MALDRFFVTDHDYADAPPPDRIDTVCKVLTDALHTESEQPPSFRRLWTAQPPSSSAGRLPSQVRVDNNTSEEFTILDIFAHDRRGLLYNITRTIFELELSVHVARIGTYLDQVVDVFYVTGPSGEKVEDGTACEAIRETLCQAVDEFLR